jgi:hypothetical protein
MSVVNLGELQRYLETLPPGPIRDVAAVESLLIACWDTLPESREGGMAAHKLRDRLEQVEWDPPHLRFTIERHGGTVLGSTRAALQRWEIDVQTGNAGCDESGHRQLVPRGSALRTQPLVEEMVEHIVHGKDHPALKWPIDRSRVFLRVGEPIPADGFKQTIAGRRRRFKKALVAQLAAAGWLEVSGTRPHTYERRATP